MSLSTGTCVESKICSLCTYFRYIANIFLTLHKHLWSVWRVCQRRRQTLTTLTMSVTSIYLFRISPATVMHVDVTFMSESIARFKRSDYQSRNLNWKIISVKEWKCSGNSWLFVWWLCFGKCIEWYIKFWNRSNFSSK